MTFRTLRKALEGEDKGIFKRADEGRGMAFVAYFGDCIIMGKHNAYPKAAWLNAAEGVDLDGEHPMWDIEYNLRNNPSGTWRGEDVWGPTGSYTVR